MGRAVAAKWFRQCKGAVSLDELQSAADLALCQAARRFDPTRIGEDSGKPVSFAPFARRWADMEVRRAAYPDHDFVELHEDHDETPASTPDLDPGDRATIADRLRQLPARHQRIARMIGEGSDDREILAAQHVTQAQLDEIRRHLRGLLADLRDSDDT